MTNESALGRRIEVRFPLALFELIKREAKQRNINFRAQVRRYCGCEDHKFPQPYHDLKGRSSKQRTMVVIVFERSEFIRVKTAAVAQHMRMSDYILAQCTEGLFQVPIRRAA